MNLASVSLPLDSIDVSQMTVDGKTDLKQETSIDDIFKILNWQESYIISNDEHRHQKAES